MTDFTITEVLSCYEMANAKVGVMNKNDGRVSCGMILKIKGKTEYYLDGKMYISDALHPIVIGKGAKYHWCCIEAGTSLIINFDADIKSDIFSLPKISDNENYIRCFRTMEHSLAENYEYSRLECKKLMYEILLYIAKQNETVPSNKKKMLKPAMDFITVNYRQKTDNAQLAKLCGISTVYFRKTFSEVYKTSPMNYLQNYRVNKAKEILSGDFNSVSAVAEELGFSSVYHFSKTFKKLCGISPSEYSKNKWDA